MNDVINFAILISTKSCTVSMYFDDSWLAIDRFGDVIKSDNSKHTLTIILSVFEDAKNVVSANASYNNDELMDNIYI